MMVIIADAFVPPGYSAETAINEYARHYQKSAF